jgi:hypothetical protein
MNRVTVLVVTLPLCLGCGQKGEWKPTGDGKTVVNSATGEIKYISTGQTQEEIQIKDAEDKQRQAELQQDNAIHFNKIREILLKLDTKNWDFAFRQDIDDMVARYTIHGVHPLEYQRTDDLNFAIRVLQHEKRFGQPKLPHPEWETLIEALKAFQY